MNHIICHTHWDREWFATSNITNSWLRELFERLFILIEKTPEYTFVLDGQTLIIEDLLENFPEFEKKLVAAIKSGNLIIGPVYSQIDFRIASEAAIIKNFEIGLKDMEKFGDLPKIAWMVDNFGFISQLSQLLRMYGIAAVFLWRGVGIENPTIEFVHESIDGSRVLCVFLIGGYRNLYGLSLTKDIAKKRLIHEIKKLEPFSLTKQIPLLDGYDLDLSPEDPFELLSRNGETVRSSPEIFLSHIDESLNIPVVRGEMLSGKYACVFPGTLSSRSYLKVEAYYIEKMLRYCDFLSIFGGESVEDLWRRYLKTLIHDNICGVAIDKVHENMEKTYRELYRDLKKFLLSKIGNYLGASNFKSGSYALCFSPHEYNNWYCDGRRCFFLKSKGVGFYRIEKFDRYRNDNTLVWKNDFYSAELKNNGIMKVNDLSVGYLELLKEAGDSYSSFTSPLDFSCSVKSIEIESAGLNHKIIKMKRKLKSRNAVIETEEKIVFDKTPLIKWSIVTTSKGKNYVLNFSIKMKNSGSEVFAKMPFEIVRREKETYEFIDEELLERLKHVLIAAREVGKVDEYPFQGFVSLSFPGRTVALMAKGLRSYRIDDSKLSVTLIRSVEWIAKKNVKGRIGDAGPLIYAPGAKCDRTTRFELAVCDVNVNVKSTEFMKWFNLFDDQPLKIELKNNSCCRNSKILFLSKLPWVCVKESKVFVYNPFDEIVEHILPGKISTVSLNPRKTAGEKNSVLVRFVDFPSFPSRAGKKTSSANMQKTIKDKINKINEEIKDVKTKLKNIEKNTKEYRFLLHRFFTLYRTMLELKLSLPLLKGRLPEKLVWKLNEVRSKKRISDYIVELMEEE